MGSFGGALWTLPDGRGTFVEVERERGIRILELDPVSAGIATTLWICRPRWSSGRGAKRGGWTIGDGGA